MGDFRMPSLGADMEEGILLEWLVAPGQQVHRGDVIAVVETPKSAVEVECFQDGTVRELVAHEGEQVPVGGVLARLDDGPPSAPAEKAPAASEGEQAAEPPRAVPQHAAHRTVSPLVRRRARELGLDADEVTGTGPGGTVTRSDVETAAAAAAAVTGAAVPRGSSARSGTPAPPGAVTARARVSPYARRLAKERGVDPGGLTGTGPGGTVRAADVLRAVPGTPPRSPEPVAAPVPQRPARRAAETSADTMRESIAAVMTASNRDIPHYYLSTTVDMAAATDWVRRRNRELPVEERLVPSALLLLSAARAAREVPELNGHWVDGTFHPADTVDLGVIVSLRRGGLLVPVIPAAHERTVGETMAALRELTSRSRAGRLRGSDLVPPSITVSNLGDQGVESVLGVIYPPQVALVGFGAVSERPWAVDGLLGVRPLVTVTLAGDHRASDGAVGARFLKRLARFLQRPEEL
jgi:pyruvate dehydrogenase E2 component (dihydrolipoamide acetyltransferase)